MSSEAQIIPHESRQIWIYFVLAAIGLVAAGVVLINSPWGLGVYHDAAYYVSAGQNLLDGNGLTIFGGGGAVKPLAHYPPLFPIMLAVVSASGFEMTMAARILIALLFGANIALAGYLIQSVTQKAWIAITVSTLLLLSPVVAGVHTMVMSEPAYLLLSTLALTFMIKYQFHFNPRWLYLSGFLSGAAYITRYIGFSVIGAGIAAILILEPAGWRKRGKSLFRYLSMAMILPLTWMGYNALTSGVITNRQFGYHPPDLEQVQLLLDQIVGWFLPWSFRTRYDMIILLISCTGVYLIWRALHRSQRVEAHRSLSAGLSVLLLYILIYLVALLISITVFDASTPINDRILSPIFFSSLLVGGIMSGAISSLLRPPKMIAIATLGLALGVLILNSYLSTTMDQWQQLRTDGIGYNSRTWQESPTIQWVSELPPGTTIYTNEALAVQFLTIQQPYFVPEQYDPAQANQRSDYQSNLDLMRTRLQNDQGILIIFHPASTRMELASLTDLTMGMEVLAELDDAYIFSFPSNQ